MARDKRAFTDELEEIRKRTGLRGGMQGGRPDSIMPAQANSQMTQQYGNAPEAFATGASMAVPGTAVLKGLRFVRGLLGSRKAAQAARTAGKYGDDISDALGAAQKAQSATGAATTAVRTGLRETLRSPRKMGGRLAGILGLGGLGAYAYDQIGQNEQDREMDALQKNTGGNGPVNSVSATNPAIHIGSGEPIDYGERDYGNSANPDSWGNGAMMFDNDDVPKANARASRLIGQGADPMAYNTGANYTLGVDPREAAKLALPPSARYTAEVASANAINAGTQARVKRYSASDFGAPDVEELHRRMANLRPEEQEGAKGQLLASQIAAIGQPKNPNEGKGERGGADTGLRDLLAADRNNIQRERLAYEMERDDENRESKEHLAFQDNLHAALGKLENPQDKLSYLDTIAGQLETSDKDWYESDQGKAIIRLMQETAAGSEDRNILMPDRNAPLGDKFYDEDLSDFSAKSDKWFGIGDGNLQFNEKGADPYSMTVPRSIQQRFMSIRRRQEEKAREQARGLRR
jgi:hypothetical protein